MRSDTPIVGAWNVSPCIDSTTNLGDCRRHLKLLFLSGETQPLVEFELLLALPTLLPRLRDWGNEVRRPSALDDILSWMAFPIELPVSGGVFVGRVDYGPVKEWVFPWCVYLQSLSNSNTWDRVVIANITSILSLSV